MCVWEGGGGGGGGRYSKRNIENPMIRRIPGAYGVLRESV